MVLAAGTGILAYILAWFIVPNEPLARVVEEGNQT